ncbi:hypothetical protein PT2222_120285 [Paraburkholderia tropica]
MNHRFTLIALVIHISIKKDKIPLTNYDKYICFLNCYLILCQIYEYFVTL